MKTLIVSSKNPVKLQAVKNAFSRIFPNEEFLISTLSTPSGVREQPMSDDEAMQGARNRAIRAAELYPDANFTVGIEGGVNDIHSEMTAFAWVFIFSGGRFGKGRTGTFFLPNEVSRLVREGKELGEADDIVFKSSNSKQQNGAVGLLTNNIIDRIQLYEQAVILALIPFINPLLYSTAP